MTRGQDFEVLPWDQTQQERVLETVGQWARTYAVAAILGIERLSFLDTSIPEG